MPLYYVNKRAQENGDHELHRRGCQALPKLGQRVDLGAHRRYDEAAKAANRYYPQIDGCGICLPRRHSG